MKLLWIASQLASATAPQLLMAAVVTGFSLVETRRSRPLLRQQQLSDPSRVERQLHAVETTAPPQPKERRRRRRAAGGDGGGVTAAPSSIQSDDSVSPLSPALPFPQNNAAANATTANTAGSQETGTDQGLLGGSLYMNNGNERCTASGWFYDLDSDSSDFFDLEEDNDDDFHSPMEEKQQQQQPGYKREEADRLEEREDRFYETQKQLERCVLVGVEDLGALRRQSKKLKEIESSWESDAGDDFDFYAALGDEAFTLEESLSEMRELIKTAGMEVSGEITQRLPEINPRTYINSGKLEQAKELLEETGCSTIVFDAELSPGQQKTLENAFNERLIQNDFRGAAGIGEIKVIDRTALILDIFAQHAKTREGKLQVDLALHEYRKPRLTRMWTHLERQSGAGGASGSVGLRGPGESQLQIDKRLVRDRIIVLKRRLDALQEQRAVRRQGRDRLGLPVLALVGYTNSGKSTCLNYLTRAGVMAESMLFATLDPTTRKVKLPGLKTHPEVLLTDTVGFIQKLPTHLVAAFRATLEEVLTADVLLHVIDVSNPSWRKQERAVLSVLEEIGAKDKPVVRVLNKVDLLDPTEAENLRYEAALGKHTVAVSALRGDGVGDLVSCIEDAMAELLFPIEVIIPYNQGVELNSVHEQGNVEVVDYRENGTYVRALVPEAVANRLEKYRVSILGDATTTYHPKERAKDGKDVDWVALGRGRH